MKLKKQTVYESEIQLEVAKVAEKYSQLGYTIYYNHKRKDVSFDLYAVNRQTGEKIIFEFKHYRDIRGGASSQITEQINAYKTNFPDCRLIVVFIRELPKFEFEPGYLKRLLYRFIEINFQQEFARRLNSFQGFEEITDMHISSIDFSTEHYINLKGVGNISFSSYIESRNLVGSIINDGVPFSFKLHLYPLVYLFTENLDTQDVIVSFDFSEFNDLS